MVAKKSEHIHSLRLFDQHTATQQVANSSTVRHPRNIERIEDSTSEMLSAHLEDDPSDFLSTIDRKKVCTVPSARPSLLQAL